MARLLLIAVIGFVVWLAYRALVKAAGKRAAPPEQRSEDMVKCSICGVNLPKSEARLVDGAYRCPEGVPCGQRNDPG